jgi:hypothetical protein
MKRYTIIVAVRALLVVVGCLCFVGCADLWLYAYRVQGGYSRGDTEVKVRRRGDAEMSRDQRSQRLQPQPEVKP